ncbi:MAG: hypothetical protein KAU60_15435 [Desulfobacterales bacterium]|nr:hypothetical protein [Desulfobacterales bacterium]
MQNLILIGGGGHCKSCIDVIEQQGKIGLVPPAPPCPVAPADGTGVKPLLLT